MSREWKGYPEEDPKLLESEEARQAERDAWDAAEREFDAAEREAEDWNEKQARAEFEAEEEAKRNADQHDKGVNDDPQD